MCHSLTLNGVWCGQLAGLQTKQDEIVEIAMHDVETGEEFDSGLMSIAQSTTRREVRCMPARFASFHSAATPHGSLSSTRVEHVMQCHLHIHTA